MKKIERLEKSKEEYFVPKYYKIDKITKQTDDEWLLRFNIPLIHDPGQFIQISIPGIGEAPISICSCNEKYFEMSIRAVGNVTNALCNLKKGDQVGLRGPYGAGYPMKNLNGNNIIIVGGGCGVAPVRGIIEYVDHNRKDFGDVNLYFGYRNPKEVLFKEDFAKWEKDYNLRVTVDKGNKKWEKGKSKHHKSWEGHTGLITTLLDEENFNNENKIVFICGPPIMIKFVAMSLMKKGFNYDQIYISNERLMKCATGMCGHCMIEGKYCCKDGPVFRYDEVKDLYG